LHNVPSWLCVADHSVSLPNVAEVQAARVPTRVSRKQADEQVAMVTVGHAREVELGGGVWWCSMCGDRRSHHTRVAEGCNRGAELHTARHPTSHPSIHARSRPNRDGKMHRASAVGSQATEPMKRDHRSSGGRFTSTKPLFASGAEAVAVVLPMPWMVVRRAAATVACPPCRGEYKLRSNAPVRMAALILFFCVQSSRTTGSDEDGE